MAGNAAGTMGARSVPRAMFDFLVKRLATPVPTRVLVAMPILGLQQRLRGDPAQMLAGEEQHPNVVARLDAMPHLDDPLPSRCAYRVAGVPHGDLGDSVRNPLRVPLERAPLALATALAIGIPAGVVSAVGRGTLRDVAANGGVRVAATSDVAPDLLAGIAHFVAHPRLRG